MEATCTKARNDKESFILGDGVTSLLYHNSRFFTVSKSDGQLCFFSCFERARENFWES